MTHSASVCSIPRLLDPFIWSYRGEGNANIVFSATTTDIPQVSQVIGSSNVILRISKIPNSSTSTTPPAASPLETVQFITQVIQPLFPKKYIPKYTVIQITHSFLCALEHKTMSQRPSTRCIHSKIDLSQTTGLLSVDYAYLNVTHFTLPTIHLGTYHLCLEIKPKWLFIPNRFLTPVLSANVLESYIANRGLLQHPTTNCRKPNRLNLTRGSPTLSYDSLLPVCRFCMHQKYRHSPPNTATASDISAFCPLDLLNQATIQHAVTCLLETPNNNLRAWINGRSIEQITPEINIPNGSAFPVTIPIMAILSQVLTSLIPLFQQLSHHQHKLDSSDSITLQSAFDQVKCALLTNSNFGGILLDQWIHIISVYLERKCSSPLRNGDKFNDVLALQLIAEFVLSMTLKDCSVLVTLSPLVSTHKNVMLRNDDLQVIHVGGQYFASRVTLLDLDPKQFSKVPNWLRMDDMICRHYLNNSI